jgi:hypothetical protein
LTWRRRNVIAASLSSIRRKTRAAERAALLRLLERAGESGVKNNINFASAETLPTVASNLRLGCRVEDHRSLATAGRFTYSESGLGQFCDNVRQEKRSRRTGKRQRTAVELRIFKDGM